MTMPVETKGDWLTTWDPEDDNKWNKKLAWNTLTVTTVSLTLCFVAWFLPSAIVPKLNALGHSFSQSQLYWLAAMPGLSGGLLRLVWMVLPPKIGTRKMVTLTTILLLLPVIGWGFEVTNPDVPYWRLMGLSFLAGIGGGAFGLHALYFLLLPQADAGHGPWHPGGHRQLRCLVGAATHALADWFWAVRVAGWQPADAHHRR